MEVVSGSGKWKYCEVVVDGPNEPPYQFNGTRCLLQSNVLINKRYLSLASLLLPMTVAMTLSQ